MSSVESLAERYVSHEVTSDDVDTWRRAQVPDQPYKFLVTIQAGDKILMGYIHVFQSKEQIVTKAEEVVEIEGVKYTREDTTFSVGGDTVGVGALEIPVQQFQPTDSVMDCWKDIGVTRADRVYGQFVATEFYGSGGALWLTNLAVDGKPLQETVEKNDRLLVSALVLVDKIPWEELGMTIAPQAFSA